MAVKLLKYLNCLGSLKRSVTYSKGQLYTYEYIFVNILWYQYLAQYQYNETFSSLFSVVQMHLFHTITIFSRCFNNDTTRPFKGTRNWHVLVQKSAVLALKLLLIRAGIIV